MSKAKKETVERIYSTCLGILPFLLAIFVLSAQKYADVDAVLTTERTEILISVFVVGILLIMTAYILIIAFLQLSEVGSMLSISLLFVLAAIMFIPVLTFLMLVI